MARRTIILSPEEESAIKGLTSTPLAQRFSMNERDIIRYVLKNARELFELHNAQQSEISATKFAVISLTKRVEDVLDRVVELAKDHRGRPKRANAKATPEEELDAGKLICEELGGTIQGNMCLYKKYEVAPSGKPQRPYEVGLPLVSLTEQMIDEQYFPSRAAYEEATLKG